MSYSATEIKVALREAAQQNGGRATRADAIALLELQASIGFDESGKPFEVVAVWHAEGSNHRTAKRFQTRHEAEDWAWAQYYNEANSTVAVHLTEYVDTPIGEEPWATAQIDLEGRFWDWEG